jgi:DNA-binding LacI/PurR family transcriptional regulator
LGSRVPEDLSIITFNKQDAEFAGIPLTMMTLPEYELGQSAVRLLQQKMAARTEKLPAQAIGFGFCEGATCAPLR